MTTHKPSHILLTKWLTKIRLMGANDYSSSQIAFATGRQSGAKLVIKPSCTSNKLVISAS
jgi:hypothetical protein